MSEFTKVSIAQDVLNEVFNNNRETIIAQFKQRLATVLENDDLHCSPDVSKLIGYASAISMEVSVELATAVAVTTLEKAGLIEPVGKPALSLVWDSSKQQNQDDN